MLACDFSGVVVSPVRLCYWCGVDAPDDSYWRMYVSVGVSSERREKSEKEREKGLSYNPSVWYDSTRWLPVKPVLHRLVAGSCLNK